MGQAWRPQDRITRMVSGVDATHFRSGPFWFRVAFAAPPPRHVYRPVAPPEESRALLDAWPIVASCTSANLILVGQGPEQERLEAQAAELGIRERVQFTGSPERPGRDPPRGRSLRAPERGGGMSNSLLEAMATGLPCVASGIGGNVDLLGEGVGRLVGGDDPAAWSATLIELLERPELARSLGAAAQRRVESELRCRSWWIVI